MQPLHISAKDGISVTLTMALTVRSNPDRILGGADYNTIISRISEELVTIIGSVATHQQVLENPDIYSKQVLDKHLDSGTAYDLLSLNVVSIAKE